MCAEPAGDRGVHAVALLGPTASGKTAVAMRIADELNLEIVSCDSRQIYRHMDIGTAKPSPEQRDAVRHWMIDIVDPDRPYSAWRYAEEAGRIIRRRASEGVGTLVCGGTGMYFGALSGGLTPLPSRDEEFRREYFEKARRYGHDCIFKELESVDPARAGRLHPHDLQRVVRALEIRYKSGRKASEFSGKGRRGFRTVTFHTFVLNPPRAGLYERINRRVEQMAARGLWEEFLALRERGYDRTSPGLDSVGYAELFDVESGDVSFEDALERIKRNTRRYAKRQITWFSRKTRGTCIQPDESGYETIMRSVGDVPTRT